MPRQRQFSVEKRFVDFFLWVTGQNADDNFRTAVEEAAGDKLFPAVENIDDSAVFANVVEPVNFVVKDPKLSPADAQILAPPEADVGILHGDTLFPAGPVGRFLNMVS